MRTECLRLQRAELQFRINSVLNCAFQVQFLMQLCKRPHSNLNINDSISVLLGHICQPVGLRNVSHRIFENVRSSVARGVSPIKLAYFELMNHICGPITRFCVISVEFLFVLFEQMHTNQGNNIFMCHI